jgi:hypothetical protein
MVCSQATCSALEPLQPIDFSKGNASRARLPRTCHHFSKSSARLLPQSFHYQSMICDVYLYYASIFTTPTGTNLPSFQHMIIQITCFVFAFRACHAELHRVLLHRAQGVVAQGVVAQGTGCCCTGCCCTGCCCTGCCCTGHRSRGIISGKKGK